MPKSMKVFWNVSGVALAIVLWEIGGQFLGESLFAPPSLVVAEYPWLVTEHDIFPSLAESLRQMLIGFALACVVGMPLGVAMGRSEVADVVFHPWVSMFVVTSAAALVPLFVMLFGTGLEFRVAIVFMSATWYIAITTFHGARGIDTRLIDVGRSFDVGRRDMFFKIMMPALYPYIIVGARIGLIHAIRAMVMAEIYVIIGYGGLMHNMGQMISTAPLMGLLLTLMAVSVAANQILRIVGRRVAPWYEERRSAA